MGLKVGGSQTYNCPPPIQKVGGHMPPLPPPPPPPLPTPVDREREREEERERERERGGERET